jgi:hypothetical protein
VPQDSGCKFLYEHTEATATCIIYINQLHMMNFTEAPATFISSCFDGSLGSVHIFYESTSAATLDESTRSIRSTGLYPVCWMGSQEELPRLHPESWHSG